MYLSESPGIKKFHQIWLDLGVQITYAGFSSSLPMSPHFFISVVFITGGGRRWWLRLADLCSCQTQLVVFVGPGVHSDWIEK